MQLSYSTRIYLDVITLLTSCAFRSPARSGLIAWGYPQGPWNGHFSIVFFIQKCKPEKTYVLLTFWRDLSKFHDMFNDFRYFFSRFWCYLWLIWLAFYTLKIAMFFLSFFGRKSGQWKSTYFLKTIVLPRKNDGFQGAPG